MYLTPSQRNGLNPKALGSTKTFGQDPKLPRLPVPALEQTLAKYLDSVKPFLTKEELKVTEKNCNDFLLHEGRELHSRLCNRAQEKGLNIEMS